MKVVRSFFTVIARFFISLIFLAGAVNKILHWHESEKSLHVTLCEWQANLGYLDQAHQCLSILIPLTPILLLVATLMELFGGLSVLLGIKEKLGAWLLILFLIFVWFLDVLIIFFDYFKLFICRVHVEFVNKFMILEFSK